MAGRTRLQKNRSPHDFSAATSSWPLAAKNRQGRRRGHVASATRRWHMPCPPNRRGGPPKALWPSEPAQTNSPSAHLADSPRATDHPVGEMSKDRHATHFDSVALAAPARPLRARQRRESRGSTRVLVRVLPCAIQALLCRSLLATWRLRPIFMARRNIRSDPLPGRMQEHRHGHASQDAR